MYVGTWFVFLSCTFHIPSVQIYDDHARSSLPELSSQPL